ncbi:MAG: PilZ domain-containing protein [Candidatus Electrothrix sp. GM3_4]|nr:PilZ domain-containing protein [Candidatus Electrothrix sp. GM3_4]
MPGNRDMPDTTSCPELFIEIGMQLTVKSCSTNESVACELIGMRCGEYLILHILKDNYSDEFHIKGKPLIVTNTWAGCVFGFSSRVIQHINSPDKLVFVEYRRAVESQEAVRDCSVLRNCNMRSSKRIDCFVPVQLSSDEAVFQARVDNISSTGCRCLVDDDFFNNNSLEMHTLITIQFSNTLSINGKVCVIRRQFLHNHHVGISFTDIDDDTQRKLTELIPSLRV